MILLHMQTLFIFHFRRRTSGNLAELDDKNSDNENYSEPRQRYSISDMITHIKRSIPDLRSVKHQPLENSCKFV